MPPITTQHLEDARYWLDQQDVIVSVERHDGNVVDTFRALASAPHPADRHFTVTRAGRSEHRDRAIELAVLELRGAIAQLLADPHHAGEDAQARRCALLYTPGPDSLAHAARAVVHLVGPPEPSVPALGAVYRDLGAGAHTVGDVAAAWLERQRGKQATAVAAQGTLAV